ncbi:MAG: GDYXXLXY domain-containing protein [Planctomycetota bacterium]|nr:GDYXXLXY domain-containing protein [Planctomycetota bacterium]
MNSTLRFWAAVVPSFLFVAAIAMRAEWTLRTGREVHLAVRAYDPMDALSGRYLAVPLAIERVDRGAAARDEQRSLLGRVVWVRLEPGEPFWLAAEVLDAPPGDPDVVALRGTVVNDQQADLWVDYGLDRFFIPQDAADPTVPRNAHRLTAVVRVTREGTSALADLLVDGETYADWNARQPRGSGAPR